MVLDGVEILSAILLPFKSYAGALFPLFIFVVGEVDCAIGFLPRRVVFPPLLGVLFSISEILS